MMIFFVTRRWFAAFSLFLFLPSAVVVQGVTQIAQEYVVVYQSGASSAAARAAITAIGGSVVGENTVVGVATIHTTNPRFVQTVVEQPVLVGAIRNTAVGRAPTTRHLQEAGWNGPQFRQVGKTALPTLDAASVQMASEPLASRQWDMRMIDAPGAHRMTRGDKRVLVGVIDTGIDGKHPDIAPNFSEALSRNFVPDGDPVDVDEGGHGTHVAGIIASPLNNLGIAGVAPNVTLVNLRAGNDQGYFFLQPTVDALTYAADIGVDVVNMSLYIDPWLFNCVNNPADSPSAQREQRAIIEATQRALKYARGKGVTLIAAAGNGHTDLGRPEIDTSSPNFPRGSAYKRKVDNSCLNLPAEGEGVISVTSVGPSGRKAYYSDYGLEQADVAAPGGDGRDGTSEYGTPTNLILAPYPETLLREQGVIAPDGSPTTDAVVRDCRGGTCAYYRYLQGTSMAAPHATGVAALIISRFGQFDRVHKGGITLAPRITEHLLKSRAMDIPCPANGVLDYPAIDDAYTAVCEGTRQLNGFYGEGVINARRAVTSVRRPISAPINAAAVDL